MNDGVTPLYIAAYKGYLGIVTALLAAGANKDQAMNGGTTPLWIAAKNGHLSIVTALLAAGANKYKRTKIGDNTYDSIDIAISNRDITIAATIASYTENSIILKEYCDNGNVPEDFLCNISKCVMDNPVFVPGQPTTFYEKSVIEVWIKIKRTNPLTREPLSIEQLQPAEITQQAIEDFIETNVAQKQADNSQDSLPPIKFLMQQHCLFSQLYDAYIIEHRGDHPDLQHEYDQRHGIMLWNPPKKLEVTPQDSLHRIFNFKKLVMH